MKILQIDTDLFLFSLMSWSPGTRVYILLSPMYKHRVEGLCGDYNGNAEDDIIKAMANNPQEFGNAYAVGSCPELQPPDIVHPCEVMILNQTRMQFAL